MRELLAKIQAHYEQMMVLTHQAGVSVSMYDSVIKADGNLTLEIIEDRLAFLEKVRAKEYEEVRYVYSLVPPEGWEMYRHMGEYNFPEQLRLNKARKALKKAWTDKYSRNKVTPWVAVDEETQTISEPEKENN